jgi:hypothetical protein
MKRETGYGRRKRFEILRAEAKLKGIQLEEKTPRNQFSMTIRTPFERRTSLLY